MGLPKKVVGWGLTVYRIKVGGGGGLGKKEEGVDIPMHPIAKYGSISRIVEVDLKLLGCSKNLTIWTWVVKTTSNCKIPILQVGWRFKLIQYSLNSLYCLRKLNEKSEKIEVYIYLFLPYKHSNSSNMTQSSVILSY